MEPSIAWFISIFLDRLIKKSGMVVINIVVHKLSKILNLLLAAGHYYFPILETP